MGGAVGHSGKAWKTDRVARRDGRGYWAAPSGTGSIRLNGRSSLRSDLAGDLLRPFRWLLLSVVVV